MLMPLILVAIAIFAGAAILFFWHREHSRVRLGPGWTAIGDRSYWTTYAWANTALMPDPRLAAALAYAYHYYPEWRPIADQAARLGTHVRFGVLPAPFDARFDASTITISSAYQGATLACSALLVHESCHAAWRGYADQLQSEIVSYSHEAKFWSLIPRAQSQSELELWLDGLVVAWRNGTLPELVHTLLHQRQAYLNRQPSVPTARPAGSIGSQR
jgi:hypothetical protein